VARPGAQKILAPCFASGLVPYEAKFHSVPRSAPNAESLVVMLDPIRHDVSVVGDQQVASPSSAV
jgi:hypothetical protein